MKFGRRCQLSVEVNPALVQGSDFTEGRDTVVIPEELSIEFDITRAMLGNSQTAVFRIYNLGLEKRNLLTRDPWELTYRAIKFRAGYADDPMLPTCFNGFVSSAVSWRTATDFITEIHAYDGGLSMSGGFVSQTIVAGKSASEVLKYLVGQLPRVSATPIIGTFPGKNLRARTLFGNTWNIILEETGGLCTIDNGQLKALNYNEVVDAEIPVITSSSGLLGAPVRGSTSLEYEMLFEPRLTVGQIVELNSNSNSVYNGLYKVMGFHHHGLISPAVAGDCSSTVQLFFGANELTDSQRASGRQVIGPFQIVPGALPF